jgi:FKBP-type peptidyl-prolyl cis-trans isomerase
MLVILAGLGACRDQEAAPPMGQPEAISYAPELNVQLGSMVRSPSGLYTRDLVVGEGAQAVSPGWVTAHYTGWFPDGREFDSSRGGDPLRFMLGAGDVIVGWDEGLAGMRVGGRRQLVIPPALAYGDVGAGGVIPPDATLVFEVEFVSVD